MLMRKLVVQSCEKNEEGDARKKKKKRQFNKQIHNTYYFCSPVFLPGSGLCQVHLPKVDLERSAHRVLTRQVLQFRSYLDLTLTAHKFVHRAL